jgi:hypothetical protein
VYNNTASFTVTPGADVPFSTAGALSGVEFAPGATSLIVENAGTYLVNFVVNEEDGFGQFAVTVNGVVSPIVAQEIDGGPGDGNLTGQGTLTLSTGDVLTLRNDSGEVAEFYGDAGFGGTGTPMLASMVLQQLGS